MSHKHRTKRHSTPPSDDSASEEEQDIRIPHPSHQKRHYAQPQHLPNANDGESEDESSEEEDDDPNEPPGYCLPDCGGDDTAAMIACDANCKRQWFHYRCMGISADSVPGEDRAWYCPRCRYYHPDHMKPLSGAPTTLSAATALLSGGATGLSSPVKSKLGLGHGHGSASGSGRSSPVKKAGHGHARSTSSSTATSRVRGTSICKPNSKAKAKSAGLHHQTHSPSQAKRASQADRALQEWRERYAAAAAALPTPPVTATTTAASTAADEDEEEEEYCFCGEPGNDDMIACDANCERQWFHYECVGLTPASVPSTAWFCPDCSMGFGR